MPDLIKSLYKVNRNDLPKASDVLADAFQDDPIWNAVFEGIPDMEGKLNAFYETPLRHCMKFGEVYAASENLEGIAGWVPGEFADMTVWRMLRSGAFISGMKMGFKLAKRMQPALEPIERDRKEHMKDMPFIYLQIIGVAKTYQRQGYGGKLVRALIEKSELECIPVYLETETVNNVRMYQRFGFDLIKKITLPVIHLPMWEMIREPKI